MKKNRIYEIILLVTIIGIIFLPFILGLDYIVGYDIKSEYIVYYQYLRESILSGSYPLWSHELFLGNNFLASKAYYLIGDIFAYVPVLLFWLSMERCLLIIQIMKLVTAYCLFKKLCSLYNFNNLTSISCSLMYMLSSWALIFIGQPMFQTSYCLFPLILIAIELFLKKKKGFLVYLSALLLLGANFYFFWSISIFLLIYWPFRYLYYYDKLDLKKFFKDTFTLVLYYILGTFTYSIVLIPTIIFMISSPRIGNVEGSLMFYDSISVYLNIFKNFITAPFNLNTDIKSYFDTSYYRLDQIALYTSFISVILLPQIFFVFSKKNIKKILAFSLILLILILTPFGGSLMHGLSDPSFRWTFIIISLIILAVGFILNNKNKINIKLFRLTSLLYFGVLFLILVLFNQRADMPVNVLVFFTMLLIIIINLFINNKKFNLILVLIISIELTCITGLSLYKYQDKYNSAYNYMNEDFLSSENKQTLTSDSEYFRVNIYDYYSGIDYAEPFNNNIGMYFDFNTVMGYDSTYHPIVSPFLLQNQEYYWWFHINNYGAQKLLSTKYQIVAFKEELPHENFKLISNFGTSEFLIYEDLDYLPFGYTYTNTINADEIFINDPNIIFEIMQDRLYTELEFDNLSGTRNYMTNINYSNNHISGDIKTDGQQLLFLSIPYDKGFVIKVDGVETEYFIANTSFIGLLLEEGSHKITIDFIPRGMKLGTIMSIISISLYIFIVLYKKKKGN